MTKLDIPVEALEPYGRAIAKIDVSKCAGTRQGKLILVTAVNPTPAGEGKTTTSIGLGDALTKLGKSVALCLREPSLGPCFGAKGGATGGGKAKLVPSAQINLHFTGDFHAVTTAHNLIAALIDNALHQGTLTDVDPRRITWRRVMDMNDRALRHMVVGLGGVGDGVVRESGFDITPTSEIMAVLCLAKDWADLRTRLERIVIGWRGKQPILVKELNATGALLALLQEAFKPNLVQTLEGTPVFVHGGPFANIAHGCSTLVATNTALTLADWVITEAGFGADLGAEKFFNIKCRAGGLIPSCAVVVATIRALKYNGSVQNAVPALEGGMPNLLRHCANIQQFGVPVVVALNRFSDDSDEDVATVKAWCKRNYLPCVTSTHFAEGGVGALDLADAVMTASADGGQLNLLYPDILSMVEKIRTVAQKMYHAEDVEVSADALHKLAQFETAGYGHLPVCIAKTQYSFSDNPALLGAPRGFIARVQDVRLAAGAGFIVVMMGKISLMPGLPLHPASERIDVDEDGNILGL